MPAQQLVKRCPGAPARTAHCWTESNLQSKAAAVTKQLAGHPRKLQNGWATRCTGVVERPPFPSGLGSLPAADALGEACAAGWAAGNSPAPLPAHHCGADPTPPRRAHPLQLTSSCEHGPLLQRWGVLPPSPTPCHPTPPPATPSDCWAVRISPPLPARPPQTRASATARAVTATATTTRLPRAGLAVSLGWEVRGLRWRAHV